MSSGDSGTDEATRQRLASEYSRGFKRSCATLRTLNSAQQRQGIQPTAGADSTEADRLAKECERGFKKSCDGYRALTGEQERKKMVCNARGVSSGYATRSGPNTTVVSGVYSGSTTCRERLDD